MTRPIIITLHGPAGPQRLELGPSELAELTERQRDALSRHVAGEPGWSRPLNRGAPPIGIADLATLARLLDLRADAMERASASESMDASLSDLRTKLRH